MAESGRGYRRRGGGTDPFWGIQHPEQTERRFGIGVTRDAGRPICTSEFSQEMKFTDVIYTQ